MHQLDTHPLMAIWIVLAIFYLLCFAVVLVAVAV